MIEGFATADATGEYRERGARSHGLPASHFRTGPGGLSFSSLGLGTYLGRPDAATDLAVQEAVTVALRSGRINVVDTAINYRHQRAERSVGRAVEGLVTQGRLRREEIFVATKVGYLAPDGESSLEPAEWLRQELFESGVVGPDDLVDGVHSMAPEYLTDQIQRSRRNLGLSTLDLVYLHNAADAQLASVGAEEFRRRLLSAFERLEEHRRQGDLRAYGLATWEAFRVPRIDPVHLDLADVVEVAREAGGEDHGFRFIQFPFNRAMPEAQDLQNQRTDDGLVPILQAAALHGVACFTNVPLLQGQLTRGPREGSLTAAQGALQFARSAPGNLAALVGSRTPEHLSEDLAVASIPPAEG